VTLLDLGLRAGEVVRFRRRDDQRWQEGIVSRLEADGSVGLRDRNGASCSIPVEHIEVRIASRRGSSRWRPLADRTQGGRQLDLF